VAGRTGGGARPLDARRGGVRVAKGTAAILGDRPGGNPPRDHPRQARLTPEAIGRTAVAWRVTDRPPRPSARRWKSIWYTDGQFVARAIPRSSRRRRGLDVGRTGGAYALPLPRRGAGAVPDSRGPNGRGLAGVGWNVQRESMTLSPGHADGHVAVKPAYSRARMEEHWRAWPGFRLSGGDQDDAENQEHHAIEATRRRARAPGPGS
jgi:hypothetical protein